MEEVLEDLSSVSSWDRVEGNPSSRALGFRLVWNGCETEPDGMQEKQFDTLTWV